MIKRIICFYFNHKWSRWAVDFSQFIPTHEFKYCFRCEKFVFRKKL